MHTFIMTLGWLTFILLCLMGGALAISIFAMWLESKHKEKVKKAEKNYDPDYWADYYGE